MRLRSSAAIAACTLLLCSCGGGGGGGGGGGTATPTPTPTPGVARVFADPAQLGLTAAEVQQIIAQAAGEASARTLPARIAVVDRVGNVLAVYAMAGARPTALTRPAPNGQNIDAQGLTIPAEAGAIAKAITGAYLSSGGNAFSSRTASMIVQQHFPPAPAAVGLESGPLFGVQFSQLPCSDLAQRFTAAGGPLIGPKRSPLGLAADPGGFPLYKNGVVVGGVGIMADGDYGFDPNVLDVDNDAEEYIALAAINGFEAPQDILADRITADGTSLRYSDATRGNLRSSPASPPAFGGIGGALVSVRGYYDAAGGTLAGAAYGSEASGVRRSTTAEFANADAYVLTNGSGTNRYPVRGGTDAVAVAQPISATEARAILEEAFTVMSRARAQIRKPLDSRAQVTISLVDTSGAVLGIVRSPDAPMFGTDVSLQKARTANFFSHPQAASDLLANPSPDVRDFVRKLREFLADPSALTGRHAFSNRAVGNLSRPYFPDGEVGRPPGPLSRPIEQFNPFSTGLQSALIVGNLGQHLAFVGGAAADTPMQCTQSPSPNRIANGIQIFPGSVPVYRGATLVGGIGVSGDGIDQDDMISFLGLHNGGVRAGGVGNAPSAIRADQIVVVTGGREVRLRYVNCPFAPFLDSGEQNVCQGK